MTKCPICEREREAGSKESDFILEKGMCVECLELLGEDAVDPQHDEVTDDAEVAKAVENWEKRRDYQRKYNSRPDVKEKRAEYMKKRNAKIKDILKRAEALGLKPKGRTTDA